MRLCNRNVSILIFLSAVIPMIFAGWTWAESPAWAKDKPLVMKDRSEERYSPDRIILKVKKEIPRVSIDNAFKSAGVRQFKALKYTGITIMEIVDKAKSIEQIVKELKKTGVVEYAEPDYMLHINAMPNDPRFIEQWALDNTGQNGGTVDADIDALEAWGIITGGSDIVVGVIDTGVVYDHEDLATNMWVNSEEIPGNGIDDDGNGYIDDIYGIDAFNNDSDPYDDNFHGTHVSGTIGALGGNGIGVTGVNWNVKIMALKFLSSDGWGWTSDAIECLEYAIKMKTLYGVNLKLTSNSWGGGGYSQALYDAIAASGNAGMLFIAAAGNSFNDNDGNPLWGYPSSYDLSNIIAVASTNRYDNLSYFSSYGAASVDLGAPGEEILSTIPQSTTGLYYSGTYDLMYFAFGFEGINGAASRQSVMQKTLDYYGLQQADSILIVDDDEGGNYESYYTDALTALGYTNHTVITVGSSCSDGPSSIAMQGYNLVIWFTGANWGCTLSPADQTALATFLDSGGNFFLTGQDIGYEIGASTFYTNYLKARYISDSTPADKFYGTGIFVGDILDLSWNCVEGACNQYWIDTIEPLSGASPAYLSDFYAYLSGTSMATPHVSGAAALIWAQNPSYDFNNVKTLILNTVDPLPALAGNVLSGGRLNVNNAISCVPGNVNMKILSRKEGFNAYTGHNTVVSVSLTDCASPMTGAIVLVTPSSDTPFYLLDDGVAPDEAAGDGVYAGPWVPVNPGPVTLDVAASGGFGIVSRTISGEVFEIPDYYYDNQIPYNWIDATVGVNTGITNYYSYADIPIGFDFIFYGVPHNTVRVTANGYLTFDASYNAYSNFPLPTRNSPNDLIAPFWSFLDPFNGGSVYYLMEGTAPNRKLTIEWHNVASFYYGGAATFEVTIYEGSNDIIFQYQDVVFENTWIDYGGEATIGIELWDGSVGLQYSYNQPVISNQSAILFSYYHEPKPDIKANSSDKLIFVTPADSVDITVSLDPGDLVGTKCDWWVGALTPNGTYWVDKSLKWRKSNTPISAGQNTLFSLSTMSLLKKTLPSGYNMFFFILDNNPDGILDMTWHDYVVVGVSSGVLGLQTEELPDFNAMFRERMNEFERK